ncbi:MAG: hypothetical protein R2728_09000 [Chitinophagales bacterium]
MTIQTQFIFDEDGKKIGAIIPIEDYDIFVKPSKEKMHVFFPMIKKMQLILRLSKAKKGQTLLRKSNVK